MTARYYTVGPLTGHTTTTDGSTVTLISLDLNNPPGNNGVAINSAVHAKGIVVAKTDSGSMGSAEIARGYKLVSGVVSTLFVQQNVLSGAAGALLGDAGIIAALATLSSSGTNITLSGTGIALTNITWTAYLFVWSCEI